jgi:hypothetical protein
MVTGQSSSFRYIEPSFARAEGDCSLNRNSIPEVAVLVHDRMEPGRYAAAFTVSGFARGISFASLTSGGKTDLRRMMLVW